MALPRPLSLAVLATALMLVPAVVVDDAGAAFPGRPGPIAYSMVSHFGGPEGRIEETGGIFVHGPMLKQESRQLTTAIGDHSPSYSPDGRLIVFVVDDDAGRGDIYVMRSDGSERRVVTSSADADADPSFFPDGERIAFSRSSGPDHHIFSVRLDGSGLEELTGGHYDDHDPTVSPDGRRIAFVSDRDPDGRGDRGDIFAMRPDGSGLGVLIDGSLYDYDPDYAPSGRRIAFASSRGAGTANVFIARADGRQVRQLTPCRPFPARCRTYSHPAFAPDGRHLAMFAGGDAIDVVRTGGGPIKTFASASSDEEGIGSRLGPPAWGPVPGS
jgi:Tol biopolymer transport system component